MRLLNRPARGCLGCGDDEVTDAAALDFGGAFHHGQGGPGDARLEARCAFQFSWHQLASLLIFRVYGNSPDGGGQFGEALPGQPAIPPGAPPRWVRVSPVHARRRDVPTQCALLASDGVINYDGGIVPAVRNWSAAASEGAANGEWDNPNGATPMAVASTTPLAAIQALGQSVWLDNINRGMLKSGELRRLIEDDGLQGMTSNPTIFEKAMGHGTDYDDEFRRLVEKGSDVAAIFQALSVADIRAALDLFRPLYDRSQGEHGFVSLEVSPLLARDTKGTTADARKLWDLLGRPNAMIKIPGTTEGLPAIEESLAAGININITLLFSVEAYEEVAQTYVRALQRRVKAGQPIDRIASVASFFVSRIDTEVDKRIEAKLKTETDPARKSALEGLLGKIAIANAKDAYASFQKIFGTPEFAALRAKGARVQKVLWASVGTKNPKYSDTLYIDELIGPDTVSTMPPATFEAAKDHARVRPSLTENVADAQRELARLGELGINFKDVTDVLLEQGIASFAKSWDELMNGIKAKRERFLAERVGSKS
jgi:transaldolase